MDTDPKSRGLKHVKVKKKYNKPKSSVHTQIPTKSKSTTILESNWSRYESNDEDNDENETPKMLDSRTDYSILANIPIGQGSHFQFKSKQTLIDDNALIKTNDLFKLDLNLLDLSISTIPFYNRCNIDKSYFSKDQQASMIRTSTNNKDIYENYLDDNKLNKINGTVFEFFNNTDDNNSSDSGAEPEDHVPKDDDNVSANFNITLNNNNNNSDKDIEIKNDANDENLEQWLDGILDD